MDRLHVRIYVLFLLLFGAYPVVVLSTKPIMEAFTDNTILVVNIRLENSTKTECFVISESAETLPINRVHVNTVPHSELVKLMSKCSKYHAATVPGTRKKRAAIFPGTKWCGIGNIAKDYSDLGTNRQVDICCRAHDNCKDYIGPFANKYGLHNYSFFTKSHCTCDRAFKTCLMQSMNSGNTAAQLMYQVYFKFLSMTCFEQKNVRACTMWYNMFLCKKYQYVEKWFYSKP